MMQKGRFLTFITQGTNAECSQNENDLLVPGSLSRLHHWEIEMAITLAFATSLSLFRSVSGGSEYLETKSYYLNIQVPVLPLMHMVQRELGM